MRRIAALARFSTHAPYLDTACSVLHGCLALHPHIYVAGVAQM